MSRVEVNTKGIRNRLKHIKPFQSIAEYIWNGFDAGANSICIDYTLTELDTVDSLTIMDNGNGIPISLVDNKFKPVLSSEKRETESQHNLVHGKNGLGRLTFYHFCERAEWNTIFKENDGFFEYKITVGADSLDTYQKTSSEPCIHDESGTTVCFINIFDLDKQYIESTLISYLKKEFAILLELKKDLGFDIKINGVSLNYQTLIKEKTTLTKSINGVDFEIDFVRWNSNLNRHSSRYYCIDSNLNFKFSKTTLFNKKSDSFYHSLFINSPYFDEFILASSENQNQTLDLFEYHSEKHETFKKLTEELNLFLRDVRAPFIVNYAKQLVDEYERTGVFPEYNANNKWECMRMDDIKETVMQLYQVEPKIFCNLNQQQKKTLIGFISLIIDSGNLDDLFNILDGIIHLDSAQRECFSRQLKTTKMSSIVNTIELISDRFKSVAEFEKLVFDPKMYAGEVPHLQTMMERNYWLIGEQYQLLTAAEPKFEEALRRYSYILRGDKDSKSIEHESRNREMDLFLIRQGFNQNIESVVIELKHPANVKLGKKELDQVYDYYQVIRSESRFNSSKCYWKFYLIGNKFDSTDYIQSQIDNLKSKGEPGLAFSGDYKVYVFTWSEIFDNFRLKHKYLQDKLQLQLKNLNDDIHDCADDIVNKERTSDSLKELSIPVE